MSRQPPSADGALDAAAVEADELEDAGRKLFASPCEFIWAAATPGGLPPLGPAEIAFAGRSNVGKSSLLNALTGRKALARTSRTPGRTQELNFFSLGGASPRLRLVDMPGYGYAAVSKEKIAHWTGVMHDYLRGRPSLARVYVLVDGRHGLKAVDYEMFEILDKAAVSYQVVLTKKDEVKTSLHASILAKTTEQVRRRVAAFPDLLFTSAETGEGIVEFRAAIENLLRQRGQGG